MRAPHLTPDVAVACVEIAGLRPKEGRVGGRHWVAQRTPRRRRRRIRQASGEERFACSARCWMSERARRHQPRAPSPAGERVRAPSPLPSEPSRTGSRRSLRTRPTLRDGPSLPLPLRCARRSRRTARPVSKRLESTRALGAKMSVPSLGPYLIRDRLVLDTSAPSVGACFAGYRQRSDHNEWGVGQAVTR
jgi:hypothetical protein